MIRHIELPLILASASPRRREILQGTGLDFRMEISNFDEESVEVGNFPGGETLAVHLAEMKGRRISEKYPESLVMSCDTVVELEGEILGKPKDAEAAGRMLRKLSGRDHRVVSGLNLACLDRGIHLQDAAVTHVVFRELSDEDIRDYIECCEPFDKAGSYGIQDVRAALVKEVKGCYFNVVGFPLALFYELWHKI